MESKKINQLATELTPALSDLTIIGDPTTGISKKITLSQMASLFTGTVEEYPNLASFPLVGTADTIYIALDTNVLYRWDTGLTSYVELSPNIINSLVFNDANGFDGTISLVGSVATLTITTALTTGSVGFIGASGALLQDNANFFWDDTNNRLGIGTNAPTTAIDTFGSGIITRVNGTSTNNAFIGFASAGTNKWSVGNVQSDHRFRIYSEANTSELVSVLQTGEFGIGIANPTTKLHIDGGASALIANLDANVSVAKSVSFRSDNSNRINLEVSGTESGSNAGMNFYLRAYSDAGALLFTPLTITRSTGFASFYGDIELNGASGNRTLTVQSNTSGNAILVLSAAGTNEGRLTYNRATSELIIASGGATSAIKIATTGAVTFSNNITGITSSEDVRIYRSASTTTGYINFGSTGTNYFGWSGSLFVANGGMNIGGNSGIGTNPNSSWGSIFSVLQLGNYGSFIAGRADSQEQIFIGTNAYYNGTNWIRTNATYSARYYISGGAHNFETASSNSAGTSISYDTKMIITNSGSVLINTNTDIGDNNKLQVAGNAYIAATGIAKGFRVRQNYYQLYNEKSFTTATNFCSVTIPNNGAAIVHIVTSAFRPGVNTYSQTITYFINYGGGSLTVNSANSFGSSIMNNSVSGSTVYFYFTYGGSATNFQNAYVTVQGVSQNGYEESLTVNLL